MRKISIAILFTLLLSFVAFGQAPQEKFATVFGAKIRYLEAGDATKPKVILLHGLGANADSWQPTPLVSSIAALSAKYHIIAPDQIGFGKSDKPFLKYRVGTYADFLDKFMSELKIEKASLVGNSLGGWVAGLMAVKYPNRVEKLILVDAAGLEPATIDFNRVYQLNNSTRDEVRANLKLIFANPAFHNEAFVDQFMTARVMTSDGYTINAIIESIKRKEDFLDNELGKIKKPTLIIWGKQDGLLPVSDAEKFNKGISGSELVVFDQCGHVPQFEKFPEFTKKVLEFLEK
jgi:pimeloyl-ACP methyl ester carboxylesterase